MIERFTIRVFGVAMIRCLCLIVFWIAPGSLYAAANPPCGCDDLVDLRNRQKEINAALDAYAQEISNLEREQRSSGEPIMYSTELYSIRLQAAAQAAMDRVTNSAARKARGVTDNVCKVTVNAPTECLRKSVETHENWHKRTCESRKTTLRLLTLQPRWQDGMTLAQVALEEMQAYRAELSYLILAMQALDGKCGWVGTMKYTRVEKQSRKDERESVCCGGKPVHSQSTREYEESSTQTWTLSGTETPTFADDKQYTALASYTFKGSEAEVEESYRNGYNSCGRNGGPPETWTRNHRQKNSGANFSGEAEVNVVLEDDGSYRLEGGGPMEEVQGETKGTTIMERGPHCTGKKPPRTDTYNSPYRPGTWSFHGAGKLDPRNASVLSGSSTQEKKISDGTLTETHTWQLRRR